MITKYWFVSSSGLQITVAREPAVVWKETVSPTFTSGNLLLFPRLPNSKWCHLQSGRSISLQMKSKIFTWLVSRTTDLCARSISSGFFFLSFTLRANRVETFMFTNGRKERIFGSHKDIRGRGKRVSEKCLLISLSCCELWCKSCWKLLQCMDNSYTSIQRFSFQIETIQNEYTILQRFLSIF